MSSKPSPRDRLSTLIDEFRKNRLTQINGLDTTASFFQWLAESSMEAISFIIAVEEEFGFKFSFGEFGKIRDWTFEDWVSYLNEKIAK